MNKEQHISHHYLNHRSVEHSQTPPDISQRHADGLTLAVPIPENIVQVVVERASVHLEHGGPDDLRRLNVQFVRNGIVFLRRRLIYWWLLRSDCS